MPKIVNKEIIRKQLLDTAFQVFSERGVHAATIAVIAKSAGMAKGTFYLYFDSKEALILALVDRIFAEMETNFMTESQFSSLEGFRRHLKKTMMVSEEHARFVRAFFEVFGPSFASDDFVQRVALFFEQLGMFYAREIEHLKSMKLIREDVDAQIAGRALASMVDGIILHRGLFSLSKTKHRKMVNASLELIFVGIKA